MRKESVEEYEGVGFHTLQVKIKGLLMKKGLWGVVKPLGQNETVTTRSQMAQFVSLDEKAHGLIITSLGDDHLHYIDGAETALAASWDTLERLFGAKSKHSCILIKMQLYGLVWREKETLSSLMNCLMSICTQLSYI